MMYNSVKCRKYEGNHKVDHVCRKLWCIAAPALGRGLKKSTLPIHASTRVFNVLRLIWKFSATHFSSGIRFPEMDSGPNSGTVQVSNQPRLLTSEADPRANSPNTTRVYESANFPDSLLLHTTSPAMAALTATSGITSARSSHSIFFSTGLISRSLFAEKNEWSTKTASNSSQVTCTKV